MKLFDRFDDQDAELLEVLGRDVVDDAEVGLVGSGVDDAAGRPVWAREFHRAERFAVGRDELEVHGAGGYR